MSAAKRWRLKFFCWLASSRLMADVSKYFIKNQLDLLKRFGIFSLKPCFKNQILIAANISLNCKIDTKKSGIFVSVNQQKSKE